MTIAELMQRIAGSDYEWDGIDDRMLREAGRVEAQTGTLAGVDPHDGRPLVFRLPLEHLRKRET